MRFHATTNDEMSVLCVKFYAAVTSRLSTTTIARSEENRLKKNLLSSLRRLLVFLYKYARKQSVFTWAPVALPSSTRTQTKSYRVLRTSERWSTPSTIKYHSSVTSRDCLTVILPISQLTSTSVLLIVGPKCTLAASHATPFTNTHNLLKWQCTIN